MENSGLMRSDVEERNARCNICSIELSIVENHLYGNRCTFCAPRIFNISLIQFLWHCYWEWRIYQRIQRLIKAKGKDDARLSLLGCMGAMGFMNINEVLLLEDKKQLYKLLCQMEYSVIAEGPESACGDKNGEQGMSVGSEEV